MERILNHLNEHQLKAVTLPNEHALIIAGAGSGKTRVLTTRIAWLMSTGQVNAAQILAVTFTNKAAKEMYSRLQGLLPTMAGILRSSLWIGTFHGLCHKMLRYHWQEAQLNQNFQIIDMAEQLSLIKRLMKQANVNDEVVTPKSVQYFINSQKEAGVRAHAVTELDFYDDKRLELYRQYEEQCQREGLVDFAELLLRSYELLKNNEPIRQHYQQRFQHILVDEFQDTNALQYQWICLLANHHKQPSLGCSSLFCVGDDDQSIYRFRGADVNHMRMFEKDFSVKHIIRLEQNYRSYGGILNAANAIISHNHQRLGKNLWTDRGQGEAIVIYEALSDTDEAQWIVQKIKGFVASGKNPSEIAMLYRANAQSRILEHYLFSMGIAYRVYGGLRFFERQEIKHALAYLRLLANSTDDSAFLRIVNIPARGIGIRSIEQLQQTAVIQELALFDAIGYLSGKSSTNFAKFAQLIKNIHALVQACTLPELIELVLEHTGLLAYYQQEKNSEDRVDNLHELVNAATTFTEELSNVSENPLTLSEQLNAFLAHSSLEAGEYQAEMHENAVQLMTVHAAKGLEFDTVFVCGVEEGLFPHENSLQELEGLEEERRLMYVAVTRAKNQLLLSCAHSRMLHGKPRYPQRSRFLDEIPTHLRHVTGNANTYRPASASSLFSSPEPVAAREKASVNIHKTPYKIGQSVIHARFGLGVVMAAEGMGEETRIQVDFETSGCKWLLMKLAKLKVV